MTKLLYIGNKLAIHGNNLTSIETLGYLLEREGYKVYYSSSKKNKLLRLFHMIFSTICLSRKTDYVLIDVYSTQNFWFAFIISQLCRVLNLRYIGKLHGGNLPSRLSKNNFLCKMIFNNSFLNVSPSKYLAQSFNHFGFKNVSYIPNTIQIENYKFNIRKIETPKLLWVRSFDKIYNPIMAVKVLIEIRKEYPNAELCMVGPDKDGEFINVKQFANKNNINVKFTGKLKKEEWIVLSNDYNVFINTTHIDNTPISVIEAMALGLPVISTNVGGIPFLLNDDNAFLVNDNDVFQMTSSIKKLILNEDLKNKKIQNARKLVEQFDWEIVKKQWITLFK